MKVLQGKTKMRKGTPASSVISAGKHLLGKTVENYYNVSKTKVLNTNKVSPI